MFLHDVYEYLLQETKRFFMMFLNICFKRLEFWFIIFMNICFKRQEYLLLMFMNICCQRREHSILMSSQLQSLYPKCSCFMLIKNVR